jgi:hypothetical protein
MKSEAAMNLLGLANHCSNVGPREEKRMRMNARILRRPHTREAGRTGEGSKTIGAAGKQRSKVEMLGRRRRREEEKRKGEDAVVVCAGEGSCLRLN